MIWVGILLYVTAWTALAASIYFIIRRRRVKRFVFLQMKYGSLSYRDLETIAQRIEYAEWLYLQQHFGNDLPETYLDVVACLEHHITTTKHSVSGVIDGVNLPSIHGTWQLLRNNKEEMARIDRIAEMEGMRFKFGFNPFKMKCYATLVIRD